MNDAVLARAAGERIRRARQARGWSQTDLGQRLTPRRSHAAVSDIERGETHLSLDQLDAIATALSVPQEELLGTRPAYVVATHRCPHCDGYLNITLEVAP